MEINICFIAGLGCGVGMAISLLMFKKYLLSFSETAKAVKKIKMVVRGWRATGQAKVAVKRDSVDEIKQIADYAIKMGPVTSLVRDAGRAQITPNPIAVLDVRMARKDVIDIVSLRDLTFSNLKNNATTVCNLNQKECYLLTKKTIF